jgi:hypothetical protein
VPSYLHSLFEGYIPAMVVSTLILAVVHLLDASQHRGMR